MIAPESFSHGHARARVKNKSVVVKLMPLHITEIMQARVGIQV